MFLEGKWDKTLPKPMEDASVEIMGRDGQLQNPEVFI